MRISILPDDPGYSMKAIDARVFLDDAPIIYAQTADEERGYVLALKMRDGKFVEPTADGMIQTEFLRGRVRIEL